MKMFRVKMECYNHEGRFVGGSVTEFRVDRASDIFDRHGNLSESSRELCIRRAGVSLSEIDFAAISMKECESFDTLFDED